MQARQLIASFIFFSAAHSVAKGLLTSISGAVENYERGRYFRISLKISHPVILPKKN